MESPPHLHERSPTHQRPLYSPLNLRTTTTPPKKYQHHDEAPIVLL